MLTQVHVHLKIQGNELWWINIEISTY